MQRDDKQIIHTQLSTLCLFSSTHQSPLYYNYNEANSFESANIFMSTKKTPTLVEIGGRREKDFIENGWSPIVAALASRIAVQSIPEYELTVAPER